MWECPTLWSARISHTLHTCHSSTCGTFPHLPHFHVWDIPTFEFTENAVNHSLRKKLVLKLRGDGLIPAKACEALKCACTCTIPPGLQSAHLFTRAMFQMQVPIDLSCNESTSPCPFVCRVISIWRTSLSTGRAPTCQSCPTENTASTSAEETPRPRRPKRPLAAYPLKGSPIRAWTQHEPINGTFRRSVWFMSWMQFLLHPESRTHPGLSSSVPGVS